MRYTQGLFLAILIGFGSLFVGPLIAEKVPDMIRLQWKISAKQVELLWIPQEKVLEFHLVTAKAVIRVPSDLYEQDYKISFHSRTAGAVVLLIVGDGDPTRLSKKIENRKESRNPKIFLINKAGMIVGSASRNSISAVPAPSDFTE